MAKILSFSKSGASFILFFLILLTFSSPAYSGQAPISEFFGIYLVAGGKLVEIKPAQVLRKANQVGLINLPMIGIEDNNPYVISYLEKRGPRDMGLALLRFVQKEVWFRGRAKIRY